MPTLESLATDVAYLRAAVDELLRRVGGVVPQQQYYPSAIEGQQIPKVTGNPSIDFTVAMLGGVPKPTPERDANMAKWDREFESQVFAGRYEAQRLTDEQAAFVYAASHRKPGGDFPNRIYWHSWMFNGTRRDISDLVNRGERAIAGRLYQSVIDAFPDGEFKRDILGIE